MPKPNGSHPQRVGVPLTFAEKHGYMEEAHTSEPNVSFIRKEERELMVLLLGRIDVCLDQDIANNRDSLKEVQESPFKNCTVGPKRTQGEECMCVHSVTGSCKWRACKKRGIAPPMASLPTSPNILFLCMYSPSPPCKIYFSLLVSG